ncbi:MAG: 23S rRNA (uracil(1939)-C(5))-methyltransferase RlmD, partial [Proteobacteria bacterium]|nr:23S rRNA (uracil(1939)-C(5))-methyltransferase RlmD [Pseudomonadota bacterium]
ATGEYETVLAGSPCIKDRLGGFEFEISANSFFQTNTPSAEILYEKVKAFAGLSGRETVVDLYSGTGTIPVFLSADAGLITGLEIVESAVSDANKNCRTNGISNCTFVLGDIRESLSKIGKKPDIMIIDPPRAGMHKDVVRQVADMAPRRIVYVSCNPATLARDLFVLKEHYEVKEVQPVDMFPHTWHIESVARLEKRR